MIGLFKQKTPVNIIIVLVLGILLKLPVFSHPHAPLFSKTDTDLYSAIARYLSERSGPFFTAVLTFLLLFSQSMILNRFMNEYRMIQKSNYLPAMSYLLITSLLPEWNYMSAPLLANTLLLLIFYFLFRMYNQQRIRGMVFNIGLALGLCSFLYAPSLIFLIWVLPGLLVMKPVKINEWLICILGLLTPYYLYAAWLLLYGGWEWGKILPSLSLNVPGLQQSFWLAGASLLLIIPFLAGGYYIQVNLRRLLIQVRKNWSLVLIYMLVSLIVPFFSGGQNFENWIVCVIPFAAFHSCAYFYPKAKAFPLLLFWLSVAFVVVYQYYGNGWII